MAEAACYDLVKNTNRPYNVQTVADMLASKGFKKGQCDKALMALAGQGKIIVKEFGKTKLFIPLQDGLEALGPEEMASVLAETEQLRKECREKEASVAALRKEVASLSSLRSAEELRAAIAEVRARVEKAEGRLEVARSEGRADVSREDVKRAEETCRAAIDVWKRHKQTFTNIWDIISENIDGNQSDLFEEIGVETDESVGEVLKDYQRLVLPPKRARVR